MLRYVDSSEMADWQAFDRLEPIGPKEDRHLLASLVAVSINRGLDRRKHQPVSPEDFMPGVEAGPDTSQGDMILKQRSMLSAMGAAWQARQKRTGKADA